MPSDRAQKALKVGAESARESIVIQAADALQDLLPEEVSSEDWADFKARAQAVVRNALQDYRDLPEDLRDA